ncbi:MAG TPA: formylglycine-generating enzyme family protein [Planctomycetaceae bacterium]|nr:formylglycine-generating enzyme family protein [Planctomycetaceae bacterium]
MDDAPPAGHGVKTYTGDANRRIRDDNGLKTKLVWCPAGNFAMGGLRKEDENQANEVQVTLTKGFWLGQHEVTQGEWETIMHTTPWKGKERIREGRDYPATHVSWENANHFLERLTAAEHKAGRLPRGWRYALPTEAQWEYACRAGTRSRFSFGDDPSALKEYGWFKGNTEDVGESYAHQVATKRPNRWGLYDMHGNVEEWCRDRYAFDLPGGTDPEVTAGDVQPVFRGGGWGSPAIGCPSAHRWMAGHSLLRSGGIGFRVAVVPIDR